MPTRLLNFDSAFSTYSNTVNTCTGKAYNCYNTSFAFKAPITKIKKILLKSAEIPVCFSNVRNSNNVSSTMIIYLQSADSLTTAWASLRLPTKHYTTITALIADINLQFVALGIGNGWTPSFTVSTTYPNRLVLNTTAPNVQIYNGQPTYGLGYLQTFILGKEILGFDGYETIIGGGTNNPTGAILANANFNLQPDLYFNMSLTNISGDNPNTNGILTTFKLPLSNYNTILNYSEMIFYQQYVNIPDGNLTLNNLAVKLTDRWGYDVDSPVDYSFTLEIEYDN